jgi:hypothetical protein
MDVYVRVSVCMRVSVCVCVCVSFVHVFIRSCVGVCVFVITKSFAHPTVFKLQL